MPLRLDDSVIPNPRERALAATFLLWNRRSHYYLGLFLLFFCWLFVLTGLLLNHPRWQFAQFWPNRVQTTSGHQIVIRPMTTEGESAREAMRQLDLSGEIQRPFTRAASGPLKFQVSRPGLVADVTVDLASGHAVVQRSRLNVWGVMNQLHTFTGVPAGDTRNERDWLLTTVWALSMDAVALGLIWMVISSYIMWYRLPTKRHGGIVALMFGFATCAAFVAGLRWLG
jgi:hypothetical protein